MKCPKNFKKLKVSTSFSSSLIWFLLIKILLFFLLSGASVSYSTSNVMIQKRKFHHSSAELELTDHIEQQHFLMKSSAFYQKMVDDCLPDETPILIHSGASSDDHDYYNRRMIIRRTWAREAKDNKMKVLFIVGLPSGRRKGREGQRSTQQQLSLQNEAQKYGDMLQFDFIDNYYNLTLKTIAEFKWIQKHCSSSR